jgi:hypothetical protein
MSNVFASDVQKQFFIAGVQDELRDSLPAAFVSDIQTDNAEYIINRYGSDISAQSTNNSLYRRASGFTYNKDKKSIDEIATATDVILYQELMREGFDIVADRKDKHTFALRKAVHRHAIYTAYQGAASILDNEVLGGSASAGTPITVSDSNPDNIAATVVQILQEENAYGESNPFVMMTPKQAKFFNLFGMGAGFTVADKNLTSGMFTVGGGTRVIRGSNQFAGLDVIVTNEMPRTAVYTLSGALTANGTVTINGVVLTAKASPAAAGEIDVAGSAEAQIDIVVAAINNSQYYLAGEGAATDYIEVSQANRTIWDDAGIKARKLSASTLEVVSFTSLTVAESDAASSWGTVKEHMLAGAYGALTIALPSKGMRVDEKTLAAAVGGTGTHGYELTSFQMHDAVVWTKDAAKLVDVVVA